MPELTTIQFIGMRNLQDNMRKISNITGGPWVQNYLYRVADLVRMYCEEAADELIYNTPESPTYRRTEFLKATVYIATSTQNDYDECFVAGLALARAIYPKRAVENTYRMEPFSAPDMLTAKVAAGATYSKYVEYGNGKVGPRPFMRVGMERARPGVVQMIDSDIRDRLSWLTGRQSRAPSGRFVSGRR